MHSAFMTVNVSNHVLRHHTFSNWNDYYSDLVLYLTILGQVFLYCSVLGKKKLLTRASGGSEYN